MNEFLRFIFIVTTTIVVAIFMTSCQSTKQVGPKPVSSWAYAPVAIKIHPLSRFEGDGRLIVHVKLLDGDVFACRGVGSLGVNVTANLNRTLKNISVRLDDPEVNREHFDDVTRTYRIPLTGISKDEGRVSVQVSFSQEDETPIKSGTHTVVRRKKEGGS